MTLASKTFRIFVSSTFSDLKAERSFVVNDEVDWVAVYDGTTGKYAVSRLIERPEEGGAMAKI